MPQAYVLTQAVISREAKCAICQKVALDATYAKAHRSAAGARKSAAKAEKKGPIIDEWQGTSRGGRSSKIHLCVDGNGRPYPSSSPPDNAPMHRKSGRFSMPFAFLEAAPLALASVLRESR